MESRKNRVRRVLVTGCDGGIGRMAAERLAGRGWEVFAACLTADGCRGLEERAGIHPIQLDLRSDSSIADAMETVSRQSGGELHGLVNNAGIAAYGPAEWVPTDRYEAAMRVNFLGPVAVTQAALPLIRKGQGRIVFVTSAARFHSLPYMSAYTASKRAADSYATAARRELRQWGILVSIVEPGLMRTGMTEPGPILEQLETMHGDLPAEVRELYGPAFLQRRRERTASMRERTGDPVRVVGAIRHALSAERPRLRYTVGGDAWLARALQWLPESVLDRIFSRIFPHG